MLTNPPVLRTLALLIMFIGCGRRYMGSSKPQELGMNASGIGRVDNTLFIKDINKELFICQIYVDDIIFGSTNLKACKEFGDLMAREFEMSMISELTFFLGF